MTLSQLVNVQISRNTAAVSQAGFGTGLILGPNKVAAGVGSYTSAADVLAEPGLTSGTDEYKAAVKYFGQTPKPTTLKIGKALAKVAQVDTITPTAVNLHVYTVTIDGVPYSYTADGSATIAEIVTGLSAAINGDAAAQAAATGSVTLILTAKTAGHPFSTSINSDVNLALVHTTANVGVVESLSALSLLDDDWYALISTFRSINDVLQLAAYIEAVVKIFGSSSNAVGLYDPASVTDIGYLLKNSTYFRSFVMFSGDTANFPEAAFFGRVLPTTPGSETWAFKTLAGIAVDSLTQTQINALKAKNVNYYVTVGGRNITLDGKVAGGEFIDVMRLIDLIQSRMMENIFGTLVRNDKLPFTNGGITAVENDTRGVLKANQKTGGIAPDDVDADGNLIPGFTTTFPKVSEVPANDRANRILSGGKFSAKLAGAIHAVEIFGNVTV